MKIKLGRNKPLSLSIKNLLLFFFIVNYAIALKGQESIERKSFSESTIESWDKITSNTEVSFANTNELFGKYDPPLLEKITSQWNTKAWKGEKVHNQILLWTVEPLEELTLHLSSLKSKDGQVISSENIETNFVGYVISDGLDAKKEGCEMEPGQDSLLVADVLNNKDYINIDSKTTQPIWLSVNVPRETPEGIYKGTLKINSANKPELKTLKFSIEVINRELPEPRDWQFHLDLWQSPDAIARVHNVEKWSDEHFKAMEPYMEMLANAGQKVITTTLIKDPWNSQTFDIYDSMIKWVKKKDGSWSYDYTVFDKYVSFMQNQGIDKLIEGYSMIPWNLKFYYYDEATGKEVSIVAEPGSDEYQEHWEPMLKDFARHLKDKGWFEKTTIAMDERPMEAMKKAIGVIRSADENFKISLAGDYHPEIERELFDYCIASNQVIEDEVLEERKEKGFTTTFYTCCVEEYPNTFTVSPPAESTWLGWHAALKGYDGYLRWAYNSWPEDPELDSRFGTWPSGDTYLIYPGEKSSIRFERLIEGIQDYEKIKILEKKFKENNEIEKQKILENSLKVFELSALENQDAGEMVDKAQEILNNL